MGTFELLDSKVYTQKTNKSSGIRVYCTMKLQVALLASSFAFCRSIIIADRNVTACESWCNNRCHNKCNGKCKDEDVPEPKQKCEKWCNTKCHNFCGGACTQKCEKWCNDPCNKFCDGACTAHSPSNSLCDTFICDNPPRQIYSKKQNGYYSDKRDCRNFCFLSGHARVPSKFQRCTGGLVWDPSCNHKNDEGRAIWIT